MEDNNLAEKAQTIGLGMLSSYIWEACIIRHGTDGMPKAKAMYKRLMNAVFREMKKDDEPKVRNLTNELIAAFAPVNPSYARLFAIKTQREAVDRLLNQFGDEELLRIIQVLEQTNKMQFAPCITTPVQLEMKIGQLKSFIDKQSNRPTKTIGIAF